MGETSEQVQQSVAFTYDWYANFLADIDAAGYTFRSFEDDLGDGDVVLRHDVDLSVDDALEMARLEAAQDVSATYFVLLSSALYNPFRGSTRRAIREIASLGHDVALHFSTHEYWDANEPPKTEALEARVAEELAVLETVTGKSTSVVSFHRPPEWVFGESYDGFTSTYEQRFFEAVEYVADSKMRWREQVPDVASFSDTVQVLTHPGLWSDVDSSFEERIEAAAAATCRFASREAHREFLGGR
jgi:peptidoglycan/xylan/chitin deacetylase (PgdA/CDA1 family)